MYGLAIDVFRQPFQKEYSYDRHKDVIKKLKFISKIEVGERINVSSVSTASDSWFGSLYRSFFKESRAKTFQFLSEVIDRSFELIILYQDSVKISDRITCAQILDDLLSSVKGLKNVQQTYHEDRNFYCDVDTLIGSIFARLAEFYEKDAPFVTPEIKARIHFMIRPMNEEIKEQKIEQNVQAIEPVELPKVQPVVPQKEKSVEPQKVLVEQKVNPVEPQKVLVEQKVKPVEQQRVQPVETIQEQHAADIKEEVKEQKVHREENQDVNHERHEQKKHKK
jgi:hypothetical protein